MRSRLPHSVATANAKVTAKPSSSCSYGVSSQRRRVFSHLCASTSAVQPCKIRLPVCCIICPCLAGKQHAAPSGWLRECLTHGTALTSTIYTEQRTQQAVSASGTTSSIAAVCPCCQVPHPDGGGEYETATGRVTKSPLGPCRPRKRIYRDVRPFNITSLLSVVGRSSRHSSADMEKRGGGALQRILALPAMFVLASLLAEAGHIGDSHRRAVEPLCSIHERVCPGKSQPERGAILHSWPLYRRHCREALSPWRNARSKL